MATKEELIERILGDAHENPEEWYDLMFELLEEELESKTQTELEEDYGTISQNP